MKNFTPDKITHLPKNSVFVFGSNLNGHHSGGAAKVAHEEFDADWGVGEGFMELSYAFPTLDENMQKRSKKDLELSRDKLFNSCKLYPNLTFYLTKVGLGIAGYAISEIAPLFDNPPSNMTIPREFHEYNEYMKSKKIVASFRGKKTLEKYGKDHFKKLAEKRWANSKTPTN